MPADPSSVPTVFPGLPATIDELQDVLFRELYVADRGLATSIFLALRLGRPILLEGEAGVGKTEVAKVLARGLDTPLIRLQCYEGLDVTHAVYEWNYAHQLLEIRLREATASADRDEIATDLFSPDFLIKRPLLQALESTGTRPPVLLIDELDRADEEFEGYLLELLSDFQVTIPELGTISAVHRPFVVLTSNRTRELGDAMRRRCLYLYIEYPSLEKEIEIVRMKVPEIDEHLAKQIAAFMHELRKERLMKTPGVSETLDWARALATLHRDRLDPQVIEETLGCVLKDRHDIDELRDEALEEAFAAAMITATGV